MSGADIIPLAIFIVLVVLIAFVGFRIVETHAKAQSDGAPSRYPQIQGPDLVRVTRQLRAVTKGSFSRQPLLNKSESRVFRIIEQEIAAAQTGHRLFAQVSLGEIMQSGNRAAFHAINIKRADMLIVDKDNWPVAAVEYQGGGHFQGTAEARDAIKEEALRKAGIGFIEIFENDNGDEIRARVREHLGWDMPAAKPEPESKSHFGRAQAIRI